MSPETAIIIRTRNEEKWIGEVLKRLRNQTYQDFEIVVVDSGSTDNTLNIVSNFPIRLIEMEAEKFTYPYAINLGISKCVATKYFVILSAHSLPLNEKWLENGLKNFELNEKVLGVYGRLLALPDGTFWDKLFHGTSYLWTKFFSFGRSYHVIKKRSMGVLGFTGAIIRRDLWEQYPIDERFAGGGEDTAWADYWMRQGYVAVMDLKFSVYHSHYLGLWGWIKQYKHWLEVAKAKPFEYLDFRKDGAHTH